MAPPPPANLPLQDRLLQLAQTLQFGWFVGHVSLLFCTFFYGLSYVTFRYNSGWAAFNYRTAFISAAATYGIVVYKGLRARQRAAQGGKPQSPQGYIALFGDENVQYLLMALIWLYSRQIPLAMLPFAVYSIFHVATYTRANLIPTLQPTAQAKAGSSPAAAKADQSSNALANYLGTFVKTYYDTSMTLVAYLEIGLWFRVLLTAFTFSKGAFLLLVIYTAFFRSRYSQSTFVQSAFHDFAARIDALTANQSMPPQARQGWQTVKGLVRKVADATDLNKYTGVQPAKKSS